MPEQIFHELLERNIEKVKIYMLPETYWKEVLAYSRSIFVLHNYEYLKTDRDIDTISSQVSCSSFFHIQI